MGIKEFFEKPKEYAVVLCGGGGKGAYQVGVWGYLDEIGLTKNIKAISGCSIGALNSLLFASGDIKRAIDIWEKADASLFTHKGDDRLSTDDSYEENTILKRLRAFISDPLTSMAPYSQEGIEDLIDTHMEGRYDRLFDDDMMLYTSTSRVKVRGVLQENHHLPLAGHYECLNGKTPEEIREWTLASCAIPGAYPPRRIGEHLYYDGGATDNVPLRPLVWARFKNIIIVHLRTADDPKEMERHITSFEGLDLRNVNIWEIYPSDPEVLGDTMELSYEKTLARLAMGYNDAKRTLSVAPGFFGTRLLPPEA
ncbi:MAG: patatin-like phospholipase family protein [Eubacterium sp.]|nr:patatin-like phospholipase family protein [Eubacterium sp.]